MTRATSVRTWARKRVCSCACSLSCATSRTTHHPPGRHTSGGRPPPGADAAQRARSIPSPGKSKHQIVQLVYAGFRSRVKRRGRAEPLAGVLGPGQVQEAPDRRRHDEEDLRPGLAATDAVGYTNASVSPPAPARRRRDAGDERRLFQSKAAGPGRRRCGSLAVGDGLSRLSSCRLRCSIG